jgi:hypothetical protein
VDMEGVMGLQRGHWFMPGLVMIFMCNHKQDLMAQSWYVSNSVQWFQW